jgi:hypothetical protein
VLQRSWSKPLNSPNHLADRCLSRRRCDCKHWGLLGAGRYWEGCTEAGALRTQLGERKPTSQGLRVTSSLVAASVAAVASFATAFAFEVVIEPVKVSDCESKLALEQIRHNPFCIY